LSDNEGEDGGSSDFNWVSELVGSAGAEPSAGWLSELVGSVATGSSAPGGVDSSPVGGTGSSLDSLFSDVSSFASSLVLSPLSPFSPSVSL
jgi:hypothetical protein